MFEVIVRAEDKEKLAAEMEKLGYTVIRNDKQVIDGRYSFILVHKQKVQ